MKLSVVIPTLNEADSLGSLLERLRRTPGVTEIIVADGGSTDDTPDLVLPPAQLVRSQPGRGMQLRAGAATTTGEVLLFLHADVEPPLDAADQIKEALRSGYVGGNFRLLYSGGGLLGRFLEVSTVVYRKLRRYYGDSGLFVLRDAYEAFGGFPEIPIMEDIVFVRRMERHGRTAYLPGPVMSSPRRWEERPVRTLLLWWFMQTCFALGVTPWRLARFYKAARNRDQ